MRSFYLSSIDSPQMTAWYILGVTNMELVDRKLLDHCRKEQLTSSTYGYLKALLLPLESGLHPLVLMAWCGIERTQEQSDYRTH